MTEKPYKSRGDYTMAAEPPSIIWLIEKSYQFYAYLFTIFVISMGLASWLGKRIWYAREKSRRTKEGQPVASFIATGSEQSFTYTTLFQGGLLGVALVLYLQTFVVAMLIWQYGFPRSLDDLSLQPHVLRNISAWMGYAPTMLAFFAVAMVYGHRGQGALSGSAAILTTVAACAAGSIAAAALIKETGLLFSVQLLITIIVSLCFSYVLGMSQGLRAADPEVNYPVVNVELLQGEILGDVWLYERTDSDYRVLTKDGSNHIIPAANVKEIRDAAG
jgi:hypothetical protein